MTDTPRCVLGIETSSAQRGSVALLRDGELLARAEHHEENAHAERLMPLVVRVLAEAGVERSALDAVAVSAGPGAFTGLRVGIALGQGMTLALGIPLLGVGTLAAL